jgi:hypothetical protein
MTLTSAAVEQLESHMPKVVDARTHGIIDYCHAAFFFSMAILWRKREPRAAMAALLTGGFILVESMLTDYPLGVKKIIPFETHGRMDAGFAGASFMMPKVFGFEGTAASKVFKGNGFAESAVVGMTDWDSQHARAEEHDGGLAIAS